MELTAADRELITQAAETIRRNYDGENYMHTVGAAIRCPNGNIYTGVNVYSLHGSCAEFIAIGAAITAGEREFESVVAIGGKHHDILYPPCGNCRQMLHDYAPNCRVIVDTPDGPRNVAIGQLLPYAYRTTNES